MSVLISLHLPKTAGSSFWEVLSGYYADQCVRDYADLPINTTIRERYSNALVKGVQNYLQSDDSVACIHGHFLPLKYRLLPAARYITWMRDPAERLASQYYYWQRSYTAGKVGEMHARVVEEGWSLQQFCLSAEFRNIYKQFLWGFPLEKFDFIGITEFYEQDLQFFYERVLGCAAPEQTTFLNENPDKGRAGYFDDAEFYSAVKAFHADDYAIYNKAVHWRNNDRERCGG